jgi:hypothetical protein
MLPIHVEKLSLSAEARKFLPPAAPPPARMMAAKGLAPLIPADLIAVQIVLTADEDANVANAAKATLTANPEGILKSAAQAFTDAALLDYLSYCGVTASVKEAILLNKNIANETLVHLAKNETDPTVLDILAGNQARMLAHPDIAEFLIDNPKLNFATKKRLEEFFINDFAAKVLAEPEPVASTGAPVDTTLTDDFVAALANLPAGEAAPLSAEEFAKEFLEENPEESDSAEAAEPEKKLSQYTQILSMKVSGKIKLALKGNKEARGILVKDSNKLVCGAVLKNPRITEGEVQTIANSKSAIEDLLRGIAGNGQWMRNYQIKLALIQNPKTPFPISQKILPTLFDKDVQSLTKSRGIPGALKQAAERLVRARQKK